MCFILQNYRLWFLTFVFIHISITKLFAQQISVSGELATSTNIAFKNYRGLGIGYHQIFKSGKIAQINLTKGYASFRDFYGDIYYGNRISVSSALLKPVLGDTRKGVLIGIGIGSDFYYGTVNISGTINPAISLIVEYKESKLLGERLGLFINGKPKATLSLEYLFGCEDCITSYAEPMLLFEMNAGIIYTFIKNRNPKSL